MVISCSLPCGMCLISVQFTGCHYLTDCQVLFFTEALDSLKICKSRLESILELGLDLMIAVSQLEVLSVSRFTSPVSHLC